MQLDLSHRYAKCRVLVREYLKLTVFCANYEIFIRVSSILCPWKMKHLRESLEWPQCRCVCLVSIRVFLVVIIVEHSEQRLLGIGADGNYLILFFAVCLKHAAAEIACSINRSFALDLEIHQVVAINETIGRHKRELGIVVIEGKRSYERRGRFIFR